ncbi:5'/3'-nucleotidase SurE [Clostridium oryzae]|uniref:5'-nucleotidase SurE n=1 Tax=Clostridium oryzae TaxID=1450648 RepID=A0A1V4IZ28_9CLOT|nr:5'/3'-nucleotidase SurE [Clostridium oryzae]OPJ65035.1 5'-nucleotidase SurE [Clostridium oryzae]
MYILITNDDGIEAPGIYALARELEKYHEVIVVAPDSQRSASSHSITLTRPLIVKSHKLDGIKGEAYTVNGTPADCVRIAVNKLIDRKVDMVVSGINNGYNLGVDILYSGTVSAAIEAAVNNIPAVAMSQDMSDNVEDYVTSSQYAAQVVNKAFQQKLESNIVINVNVPSSYEKTIKGIKVCRVGAMLYTNYFVEKEINEMGTSYDVLGDKVEITDTDTDTFYISQGYVTLTPLHYDFTNVRLMEEMKKIYKKSRE